MFFLAVILVIIGTYLLFVSGSVLICRLLQKNKKYYYKANHFVSVSSMTYRMKRNGAGLATICILATMVLVMLASTSCLYIGTEDSFYNRYPQNIIFNVNFEDVQDMNDSNLSEIKNYIAAHLTSINEEKYGEVEYAVSDIEGEYADGAVDTAVTDYTNRKMVTVHIMSLDNYNKMAGTNETLNAGGGEGNPYNISSYSVRSAAETGNVFYGSNGGLFFPGILLSVVFVFATVLIIYYKQVSEGYEDQARFEIMQKVGMTKKEIRKSINSQILTVFFMPLITAGVHLWFAFPFIKELLILFGILNTKILIITTVISFLLFALFYVIVFKITSNVYYSVISGARE